jgi:small-conductance mechanosensitive channel
MRNNFDLIFKITASFIIMGCFAFAGFIAKMVNSWYLRHLSLKRKREFSPLLMVSVQKHLFFWFILAGTYFCGLYLFPYTPHLLFNLQRIVTVLFIASATLLASKIVFLFIKAQSDKIGTTIAMSDLTQRGSRVVIFALGALMALNSLGISITPLLATLGIGGLAIALALQETLSNVFAGFHIILAKQIRIGDYVRLDTTDEGYVLDVSWRLTKIKTLSNNVVLVPNSKMSQAIITNYYLPQKEMTITIEGGVHYDSNLEEVEKTTLAVARQVMNELIAEESEPSFKYTAFGPSSINFAVTMKIREFRDQFKLKHEFIKQLHKKFKEKGIVIPYPVTALNVSQEKAHFS